MKAKVEWVTVVSVSLHDGANEATYKTSGSIDSRGTQLPLDELAALPDKMSDAAIGLAAKVRGFINETIATHVREATR